MGCDVSAAPSGRRQVTFSCRIRSRSRICWDGGAAVRGFSRRWGRVRGGQWLPMARFVWWVGCLGMISTKNESTINCLILNRWRTSLSFHLHPFLSHPQSHLCSSRTTNNQRDGNVPPARRTLLTYRPKVRARKRRKKRRRKRKRKRRAAGDGIAVGTVAWRNVRCTCGTWEWASTQTRLSFSSSASAPARGLVGTTTWLCALCWPTVVCPSARPGRLAYTLAAGPRAMNRSLLWMLPQPGEPSSPSPQQTVSAWDEASWRGEGERDLKKWCNERKRRNREASWAVATEQGRVGWPWWGAVREFGFAVSDSQQQPMPKNVHHTKPRQKSLNEVRIRIDRVREMTRDSLGSMWRDFEDGRTATLDRPSERLYKQTTCYNSTSICLPGVSSDLDTARNPGSFVRLICWSWMSVPIFLAYSLACNISARLATFGSFIINSTLLL